MLNAARANGRPTIVIAITKAARSHSSAMYQPPKTIHRMFRSRLIAGIWDLSQSRNFAKSSAASSVAASPTDVAELAVQIEIGGDHRRFHPGEALLELGEGLAQRVERIVGRRPDAPPKDLLFRVGVELRRLFRQQERQRQIGDEGRHEEEDHPENRGDPDHLAADSEIVGDAGADPGDAAVLGVAVEPG